MSDYAPPAGWGLKIYVYRVGGERQPRDVIGFNVCNMQPNGTVNGYAVLHHQEFMIAAGRCKIAVVWDLINVYMPFRPAREGNLLQHHGKKVHILFRISLETFDVLDQ